MNLTQKVKEYINEWHFTIFITTMDKQGNAEINMVDTALMADPNTIKIAKMKDEKSYENLKNTKKALFLVIVPEDKIKGIIIKAELVKDETQGEEFETMQAFVNELGGGKMKNLLTFKIIEIKPATVL